MLAKLNVFYGIFPLYVWGLIAAFFATAVVAGIAFYVLEVVGELGNDEPNGRHPD